MKRKRFSKTKRGFVLIDDIVYINEDGSRETWKDTTKSTVLEDAKNDYKECISALERIECALKALSNNERV